MKVWGTSSPASSRARRVARRGFWVSSSPSPRRPGGRIRSPGRRRFLSPLAVRPSPAHRRLPPQEQRADRCSASACATAAVRVAPLRVSLTPSTSDAHLRRTRRQGPQEEGNPSRGSLQRREGPGSRLFVPRLQHPPRTFKPSTPLSVLIDLPFHLPSEHHHTRR